MGYVYRYTDLADGIIKYVGIVWSDNRTLSERINEHDLNDEWCKVRRWKIEYITENITTRTDAEYFEAHYISLYGTDQYFNSKKSGWGVSSFLPKRDDWMEYKKETKINRCEIERLKKDILDKQGKLNSISQEVESKRNELKNLEAEIAVSRHYYIENDYEYKFDIRSLLEELKNQEECYKGFMDGITSKASIAKWEYRSQGVHIAIGIVERFLIQCTKHPELRTAQVA